MQIMIAIAQLEAHPMVHDSIILQEVTRRLERALTCLK